MIPPDFSLFDVVLEMRKQRPAAVQTEEQYRFLYHTVAQMFCSMIQNASLHYQNIKANCAPLYDDALFLRTPQALLAIPHPTGGVLRPTPFLLHPPNVQGARDTEARPAPREPSLPSSAPPRREGSPWFAH
ncbi:hypothetical protein H8959_000921 [Pygathrix nigripes]